MNPTKRTVSFALTWLWLGVQATGDIILRVAFTEPGYNEAGNTVGTTANNLPWTSDFGETASTQ